MLNLTVDFITLGALAAFSPQYDEETGAKGFVLFFAEVHPGGEAEIDTHPGREHCCFMLSGAGKASVNGKKFTVRPGDCLWIPPGAEHGIIPIGGQTIRFAVMTSPAPWIPAKKNQ